MTPEQLGQFLDELGKRLGPTGDHVYQLAVRQAIISNAVWLLASIVMLITAGIGGRWAWGKMDDADSYDRGPGRFLVALGTVTLSVAGLVVGGYALIALLNPEYTALRDILSAVGGVK